jgi:hypothetical protein
VDSRSRDPPPTDAIRKIVSHVIAAPPIARAPNTSTRTSWFVHIQATPYGA